MDVPGSLPEPAQAPPGEGFCDSHIHVVDDPARYPLVPARTYTPAIAPLSALERHAAPGVTRFVVVQPSFYGTDNSLLLATLDGLAGDAGTLAQGGGEQHRLRRSEGRGVAVIDPARTGSAELAELAQRGIRGLRINLYSTLSGQEGGAALHEAFDATARAARAQDWHVEVIAPIAMLAEAVDLLARSPVPVVIDHYGLHAGTAPDSQAGRALLEGTRVA